MLLTNSCPKWKINNLNLHFLPITNQMAIYREFVKLPTQIDDTIHINHSRYHVTVNTGPANECCLFCKESEEGLLCCGLIYGTPSPWKHNGNHLVKTLMCSKVFGG